MDDSDEEQEKDEDMLLACILVGEYLEAKEERPKFYVREKKNIMPASSDALRMLKKYLSALQGCTTFASMRAVFVLSIQMTILKMKLDIFHLILVKLLLQEILCCKIS